MTRILPCAVITAVLLARTKIMKLLLFGFAVFVVSAAIGNRAVAQNYPWCAYYSGGGTNCGFVTFEQCLTTVSGIGGFCNRNTQYVPGAPGDFNPWSRKLRTTVKPLN